ncbi:MAG: alkaline phosphatase [Gammaproteobacteria bacterium]|nr:MAG: alkaline phosphatase [Gammaproteobacteria bacterium]
MKRKTLALCLSLALAGTVSADEIKQQNNDWFKAGQDFVASRLTEQPKLKAKNVILFVGDGMSIATLTASRIYEGQLRGESGEENLLSFEKFPYTALVKTYNTDAQTADSAGTAAAMVTGIKTDKGVLGVNENIEKGKCDTVAGNEATTILEMAEAQGLSTGIVTTARVTHATPASNYAKTADRGWEDNSKLAKDAVGKCEDIASQLVNFEDNMKKLGFGESDGIEVVMGGGRRHFLPKDAKFNSADNKKEIEGKRTDGRNLIDEWQAKHPDGKYIMDTKGFEALDAAKTKKVLGLFNSSHMRYEADRKNDIAGEPSLTEMTKKAIDILDNNDKGFYLMVEGGRIDHAHHAGNAAGALTETVEMAKAVQAAYEATNPEETLILVTADHGHVFSIAGYPKRGNPILGKVVKTGKTEPALAEDGKPYTTLGYMNGRGFMDLGQETNSDKSYKHDINAGRADITDVDTTAPGYHQEALIPNGAETHSGEDVALFASGPASQLVRGTMEQNVIFHIMRKALFNK